MTYFDWHNAEQSQRLNIAVLNSFLVKTSGGYLPLHNILINSSSLLEFRKESERLTQQQPHPFL